MRIGGGWPAALDLAIRLSFSDLDPALCMVPPFMFQPDGVDIIEGFELSMRADRAHFCGWNLHNALRAIAPYVTDTHGFIYDWNTGGYLDEIAVTEGHLTIHRAVVQRPARAVARWPNRLVWGRPRSSRRSAWR
jgi:hypothetical protein